MYTISAEADKKVQEDLDTILSILTPKIDPVSVILFGGFGKGEGSFEIVDGLVRPLNDYDIYVITKKRLGNDYLEDVSMECSKAIGRGGEEFCENPHALYDADRFFHVDLREVPRGKLPKLKPMQRTYEMKRSPVIYGKDVRSMIPDVEVPVSDAIRLLFNKLHHLLLGRDNDVRIKTIYVYKAYLDCCAALLMYEKNFAATYRERNDIFQALDYPASLKDAVGWATEFRMQPAFDLDNLDERWTVAQKWVLWSLKKIIRKTLKFNSDDWSSIANAMYLRLPYNYFAPYLPINLFPAQYMLNYFYVRRARKCGIKLIRPMLRWRDAGIILGIAMLLYHVQRYDAARYYLKKIEAAQGELKDQLLKLFGLYYSQRII